MTQKRAVNIEIDKLTNSIVNAVSGEVFETVFGRTTRKELRKKEWIFNWHHELKDKSNRVYKMTTVENANIIHGLISLSVHHNFVFVNLVENASFNKGKGKLYEGVGGNLFAFACKMSADLGYGGCISFVSKTSLMKYYSQALGAVRIAGQRMVILESEAEELINRYFKTK